LVAAAVAAVGLVAMFWLGTNLRQIAGGGAPSAPTTPVQNSKPPLSLAEMVAARKHELEEELRLLGATRPQTRESRARAAEARRELVALGGGARGGGAGGWLDAGAWWRWLRGQN
jgi:hypothetical protein